MSIVLLPDHAGDVETRIWDWNGLDLEMDMEKDTATGDVRMGSLEQCCETPNDGLSS